MWWNELKISKPKTKIEPEKDKILIKYFVNVVRGFNLLFQTSGIWTFTIWVTLLYINIKIPFEFIINYFRPLCKSHPKLSIFHGFERIVYIYILARHMCFKIKKISIEYNSLWTRNPNFSLQIQVLSLVNAVSELRSIICILGQGDFQWKSPKFKSKFYFIFIFYFRFYWLQNRIP